MKQSLSINVHPCFAISAALWLLFAAGCAHAEYPAEYRVWRKQTLAELRSGQTKTSPSAESFVAAALMNDRELIVEMRRCNLDINAPDPKTGQPPLIMAIYAELTTATKNLLEAGASPNVFDEQSGNTAILISIGNDDAEVMRLLLRHKADPDAKHRIFHQTPLHAAATDGQVDLARVLLEYKANPNARDRTGVAPIHLAALKNHIELAKLLIDHGADVNQLSDRGTTALMVARRSNFAEMIELLKQAGAKELPDPLSP